MTISLTLSVRKKKHSKFHFAKVPISFKLSNVSTTHTHKTFIYRYLSAAKCVLESDLILGILWLIDLFHLLFWTCSFLTERKARDVECCVFSKLFRPWLEKIQKYFNWQWNIPQGISFFQNVFSKRINIPLEWYTGIMCTAPITTQETNKLIQST